jgi:hypothetical protein
MIKYKFLTAVLLICFLQGCGNRESENFSRRFDNTYKILSDEKRLRLYEEFDVEKNRIEGLMLEKCRAVKSVEFLAGLKNGYRYFRGRDTNGINYLCELEFDGDTPVLQRIDFYNGEKVILKTEVLSDPRDTFTLHFNDQEMPSKGYRYTYSYAFGAERGTAIRFDVSIEGNSGYGGAGFDYVSLQPLNTENIDEILGILNADPRDAQRGYAGEYDFERVEILLDEGNEADGTSGLQPDINEYISILYTGTGNLHAFFSAEEDYRSYSRNIDFFIERGAKPVIYHSMGDGHSGSHELNYYFEGDYIVYHSYSEAGYFEGGAGRTLEYKVYYRRRP